MSLPRPAMDAARYMQVRCDRGEVAALRTALGKLGEAIALRKRRRLRRFLALTGVLLAFAVAHLVAGRALSPAGAMALAAAAYGFAGSLLVSLFQRQGSGLTRAPRAVRIFLLVNPGCFLYFGAGAVWQEQAADLDPVARPLACAVGLAASLLVLLWIRQLLTWGRLGRVEPQRLEVDYLARIVGPLLADLPPEARATITFNPFRSEWSRQRLELPLRRPGYTFDAGADVLLALKLPLDDARTFRLSVVEYSVHKTKNRKGKYKGTKRRLAYRCALQRDPGAGAPAAPPQDLSRALAEHLRRARAGWTPAAETAGGYFTGLPAFQPPPEEALRLRAEARPDGVSATLVLKSAGTSRELAPEHLLPPSLVLAAVQFLGQAAA